MKKILLLSACIVFYSSVKSEGAPSPKANDDSNELIIEYELPEPFVVTLTPVLYALEVTQVIQDWRNKIKLIANKTTLVRAHIQSKNSSEFRYSDNRTNPPQLFGRRGTTNLGAVTAVNAVSFVALPLTTDDEVKKDRREKLETSLNFMLPDSWLQVDNLELTLEGGGGSKVFCEEPAEQNGTPNDCKVSLVVLPPKIMRIAFYGVDWIDHSGQQHIIPSEIFYEHIRKLRRQILTTMPISDCQIYHHKTSVGQILNPLPAPAGTPPSYEDFLGAALHKLGALNHVGKTIYYGVLYGRDPVVPFETAGLAEQGGRVCATHVDGGDGVASHEIGHIAGRHHVSSDVVTPEPFDNNFPAINRAGQRPLISPDAPNINDIIFGYDSQKAFTLETSPIVPYYSYEVMSYLPDKWVSDYTYNALTQTTNPYFANRITNPGTGGNNIAKTAAAFSYKLFRGSIVLQTGQMKFEPVTEIISSDALASLPTGPYQLQLRDAQNATLTSVDFSPTVYSGSQAYGYFTIPVPSNVVAKKALIVKNGVVLGELLASNSNPTVQLLLPNGGNLTGSSTTVKWRGSDNDGNKLYYGIQFSKDSGATWRTIDVDIQDTTYQLSLNDIGKTGKGFIRVTVSDSFNIAIDTSDAALGTGNVAPICFIDAPVDSSVYVGAVPIIIRGSAQDIENGKLTGASLSWSSNRNGSLGTGTEISRIATQLQQGEHIIKLTVTDADGATATDSIRIKIVHSGNTLLVSAKAFLQGPYNQASDMMIDSLRTKNLLPNSDPYPSLGYVPNNYIFNSRIKSGVLDSIGIKGIVDWVWLELRNASNPAQVVATRAALQRRDGNVVDMDGASPVSFLGYANGNYYVAVRHRNHLGVMTASAIALNSTTAANINFTLPATATYGSNACKNINGVMVLWAGDANGDGVVRYTGSANDKDALLVFVGLGTPNRVLSAYHRGDINLNGQIRYIGAFNDKDFILSVVGLGTPAIVIIEQIPK